MVIRSTCLQTYSRFPLMQGGGAGTLGAGRGSGFPNFSNFSFRFRTFRVFVGSVRFGLAIVAPGSTRFGLRFSYASWFGPVRFDSVLRPVPAGSEMKRFASLRFGWAESIRFVIPS